MNINNVFEIYNDVSKLSPIVRNKSLLSYLSYLSVNDRLDKLGVNNSFEYQARSDWTEGELFSAFDFPYELKYAFWSYDAYKLELFSDDELSDILMSVTRDIITTDKVMSILKILELSDESLYSDPLLIKLKNLSICYELEVLKSIALPIPDTFLTVLNRHLSKVNLEDKVVIKILSELN